MELKVRTNYQRILILTLLIATMAYTLTAVVWPKPVQAGSTLPSRQPPAPTTPPQDDDKDSDKPIGASIELHLHPALAGVWTVVQWQDSANNWRDVEGWSSEAEGSTLRWWVAAKDFGTGSFRWVVRQGLDGPQLGVSKPFNLPGSPNETAQIEISY
jgi:hypothetical protein